MNNFIRISHTTKLLVCVYLYWICSIVFNKELEKDVIGDTSGDFKKLLISFLQGDRPEGQTFDREEARKDAQEFWEAGEGVF